MRDTCNYFTNVDFNSSSPARNAFVLKCITYDNNLNLVGFGFIKKCNFVLQCIATTNIKLQSDNYTSHTAKDTPVHHPAHKDPRTTKESPAEEEDHTADKNDPNSPQSHSNQIHNVDNANLDERGMHIGDGVRDYWVFLGLDCGRVSVWMRACVVFVFVEDRGGYDCLPCWEVGYLPLVPIERVMHR